MEYYQGPAGWYTYSTCKFDKFNPFALGSARLYVGYLGK